MALVGCLELLVAVYGERRGVAAWVTAGVVGTATGPFAGGLLTQAFSWQAIFVVQVPFAVLAVPAALAVRAAPELTTGPAPSGGAPQPDPRLAVGRAHGGVVPPGPAPGRGLAPLPGDRGTDGVRRAGRGSRRTPARPPPATSGRGRGRGGLLPHRRRTGRPRDLAVGRPRLDHRAPGAGGPRARADRRPAHLSSDGDAPASGSARGVDHQRSPCRRGRGAGDPDAGVHRGPAGRRGARAGGDRVLGARRSAEAGRQDRDRTGARPRAVGAAGPDPRPAPRVRRRRTSTPTSVSPRPSSNAISTPSWSAPPRGPSATRSSSAPASRSSPCSP